MHMIFDSEEDLIIAMKKHDQDALKEVINQYGKLILYIIHKLLSTPIEKQYVDDFFQCVCNSNSWASSFKIFNVKIKSGIIAAFYRLVSILFMILYFEKLTYNKCKLSIRRYIPVQLKRMYVNILKIR